MNKVIDKHLLTLQRLNSQGLQKYKLSKDCHCLESVINDNSMNAAFSSYGDYGDGQLWLSYDGSLNDGLTLFASDDDNDIKPHGDFNASYEQ